MVNEDEDEDDDVDDDVDGEDMKNKMLWMYFFFVTPIFSLTSRRIQKHLIFKFELFESAFIFLKISKFSISFLYTHATFFYY